MELYANILEENERLVPLLKAKLGELREKERSNFIVIGKGDCGRPCYAFNPVLFISWPECKGAVKEEYENGTYQKQVLDKETGQYVWREFHNEENICLHFNYYENVDPCDIDFAKMCDFFDKEDKEKTVHWFPYGLQMREFFHWNDENLFPRTGMGWEGNGHCFGLFEELSQIKIGKSIGFFGVNMFHYITIFKCTNCKLVYHVINTCPLMHRDKSKDPK